MPFTLHIQNEHALSIIPDELSLQRFVSTALKTQHNSAELCIRFVRESESQALNAEYRQKDKPTNILSFPVDLPSGVALELPYLGDLVVCPAVVLAEAKQCQVEPQAHWAHIIIHGTLHLLGYDHIRDADANIMETLEVKLLAELGFESPYEDTTFNE